MRLLADLIRGMHVEKALAILEHNPKLNNEFAALEESIQQVTEQKKEMEMVFTQPEVSDNLFNADKRSGALDNGNVADVCAGQGRCVCCRRPGHTKCDDQIV